MRELGKIMTLGEIISNRNASNKGEDQMESDRGVLTSVLANLSLLSEQPDEEDSGLDQQSDQQRQRKPHQPQQPRVASEPQQMFDMGKEIQQILDHITESEFDSPSEIEEFAESIISSIDSRQPGSEQVQSRIRQVARQQASLQFDLSYVGKVRPEAQ